MLFRDAVCVALADAAQANQVAPDAETVAAEIELVFALEPVVFLVAVDGICTHEILLERQNLHGQLGDRDFSVSELAAVLFDKRKGMAIRHLRALCERDIRALEIEVPNLIQRLFPEVGQFAFAVHHSEHAAHRGGIAVGILAAAGRDLD